MKPLSVIVVDDEEANCENLADILEMAGHVVTWSASPNQVWADFQSESTRFDLAILDLKMPEMSGVELLKKMRQIQPDLPAILTTAYMHDEAFQEHDRELFECILDKPVNIDLLLTRVRQKEFPLVICVDDDADFCDNLVEIFSTQRIHVECFHNFEDAKQGIAEQEFDVALLDLRLPDIDGVEAAKLLKQVHPQIKSFLITGYPSELPASDTMETESVINYVFEKPVKPDLLLGALTKLQRQH